jgi:hypothetical protein
MSFEMIGREPERKRERGLQRGPLVEFVSVRAHFLDELAAVVDLEDRGRQARRGGGRLRAFEARPGIKGVDSFASVMVTPFP